MSKKWEEEWWDASILRARKNQLDIREKINQLDTHEKTHEKIDNVLWGCDNLFKIWEVTCRKELKCEFEDRCKKLLEGHTQEEIRENLRPKDLDERRMI